MPIATYTLQTLPTHSMHAGETQYTLPQAKNRLSQTYLELFHCKPGKKKKRQARTRKLLGILQRFSEAWSLALWTEQQAQPFSQPGRADGWLCSQMNRATSMESFPSKINAEIDVCSTPPPPSPEPKKEKDARHVSSELFKLLGRNV